jgi:outer membrane biosynthesis protein TonB
MVGYKVDPPTGESGLLAAVPQQPFPAPSQKQPLAPPALQTQPTPQQPPIQTAEPNPPKPPAIAAVPVPASALIRPDTDQVAAVVQENSGSYQQVDVFSQPPGATSEPPIPISLSPEQIGAPSEPAIPISLSPGQTSASPDSTLEYELELRKKPRTPWFIAAGIVLLSATGFAAYRFVGSESAQDTTPQEPTEPIKKESPQPTDTVATKDPDQEKKSDPSLEAQKPTVEEKKPADTAEPAEKSAAEAQEAQAETPPQQNAKEKKSKERGPDVVLLTKRARFKRGKLDKEDVFARVEKNLPKIKRCYTRALRRKKNLKGRVTFAWTIKKNGYVYGAKRIQGPIKDKKMINCARRVLNKIRYKRPKGQSARVIMPLLFKRPK